MGRRRHGGGGFDGARPRRIRRFVEPAVLLLLHREPNHGYGLLEGLRELGLERYPMDVSAIYRILYDLEAAGMVVSQESSEGSAGPPRRVYELTEQGDAYLAAWVEDLRLTDQILHRFFRAYDAAEGHAQDLDDAMTTDETGSQSTTQQ
jgi:DNA-binding PadR family transcriptional regulator